ncbi:hypothetical protein T265_04774 [Opisthorchis viverrini]|uniref:DUF6451 domain-containing protein n=1 Tax=Opisthorchis viverrini TaxID=6198 RepID=A0A074ZMP1_OPIVI|nr:hypothetical protein T265_04774 [Opisthorchis viverrini]KER28391.1 hypothetical protein T265_04774 [Opisthorchis viverrini]
MGKSEQIEDRIEPTDGLSTNNISTEVGNNEQEDVKTLNQDSSASSQAQRIENVRTSYECTDPSQINDDTSENLTLLGEGAAVNTNASDIFNVDLSNLPYPPGYTIVSRHEPKQDRAPQKEEESLYKGPRMTKEFLKKHCAKNKLYQTPHLNDVLYLHYNGLRCLFLEVNGLDSLTGLENQKELRSLYLAKNLLRKIENLDHMQYLDTLDVSNNMITKIENLDMLPNFTRLIIAHNKLTNLEDLLHVINCPQLSVLDLQHNHIKDPEVVEEVFAKMPSLKQLTYLDDRPVFPKDRACAEAFYEGGAELENEVRQKWNAEEQQKIIDSCRWLREKRQIIEAKRREKELREAAEAAGLPTDNIHVNPGDIDWLYGASQQDVDEETERNGDEDQGDKTEELSEPEQNNSEKVTSGAGDMDEFQRTQPRLGPIMAAQMIEEVCDELHEICTGASKPRNSASKEEEELRAFGQITDNDGAFSTNGSEPSGPRDGESDMSEQDAHLCHTKPHKGQEFQSSLTVENINIASEMPSSGEACPNTTSEPEVVTIARRFSETEEVSIFGCCKQVQSNIQDSLISQLLISNNSNQILEPDDESGKDSIENLHASSPLYRMQHKAPKDLVKECHWANTSEAPAASEWTNTLESTNPKIIELDVDADLVPNSESESVPQNENPTLTEQKQANLEAWIQAKQCEDLTAVNPAQLISTNNALLTGANEGSDPVALQTILNNLNNYASRFGMCFTPAKCKVLLQDRVDSNPSLMLAGEPIEVVAKFVYLGSCISPGGLAKDDISIRIGKARAAFANLRHLWRRRDISFSVKGRVYNAAVRSVLLYGSETWPLRAEDVKRLSVFDHRCLRSIARIWWEHRMRNLESAFVADASSPEHKFQPTSEHPLGDAVQVHYPSIIEIDYTENGDTQENDKCELTSQLNGIAPETLTKIMHTAATVGDSATNARGMKHPSNGLVSDLNGTGSQSTSEGK